jgi:hypothetical protein
LQTNRTNPASCYIGKLRIRLVGEVFWWHVIRAARQDKRVSVLDVFAAAAEGRYPPPDGGLISPLQL